MHGASDWEGARLIGLSVHRIGLWNSSRARVLGAKSLRVRAGKGHVAWESGPAGSFTLGEETGDHDCAELKEEN